MASFEFADKHVVVTGGSSGIGRAFVRAMVDRHARVSVIALPDDDLANLELELKARAATFAVAGADVSDEPAVDGAVTQLTGDRQP